MPPSQDLGTSSGLYKRGGIYLLSAGEVASRLETCCMGLTSWLVGLLVSYLVSQLYIKLHTKWYFAILGGFCGVFTVCNRANYGFITLNFATNTAVQYEYSFQFAVHCRPIIRCLAPYSDLLAVVKWTTAAINVQFQTVTCRVRRTATLLDSAVVRLTERMVLCSCLLWHHVVWCLEDGNGFVHQKYWLPTSLVV